MDTNQDIFFEKKGKAGVITLNRPSALNALSFSMVLLLTEKLKKWADDSAIEFVIIKSKDPKSFCVGGDIRAIYDAKRQNDLRLCDRIFRYEYTLSYLIAQYPKPYIALINGLCMGGGMGISIHGSYRIVTEKAVLAMPENKIGFFPDVGASFFLDRCPGQLGVWMGLTGQHIKGADAVFMTLGTHYLPSQQLDDLYDQLIGSSCKREALSLIESMAQSNPPSLLSYEQEQIDTCFKGETVEEIIKSFHPKDSRHTQWASSLQQACPLSLKLFMEMMKRNQGLPLKECLKVEFRLSQHLMHNPNFFEGIRALLIDKDKSPYWLPSALHDVTPERVSSFFDKGVELDL